MCTYSQYRNLCSGLQAISINAITMAIILRYWCQPLSMLSMRTEHTASRFNTVNLNVFIPSISESPPNHVLSEFVVTSSVVFPQCVPIFYQHAQEYVHGTCFICTVTTVRTRCMVTGNLRGNCTLNPPIT